MKSPVLRSLTKMWFRTSGMLATQSAGNFGFGVEMALQDIAEEITRQAEKGFVEIEDGASWVAECLYHAKKNLRYSWNWATHKKGSNPLLLDDDPKRKWRKAWHDFGSACYHVGLISRLVWQEERHRWNGPRSLRIRIGGLWFGGAWRKNCHSLWAIYNGRPFNFQVQTWRPRIAFWKPR